MINDLALLSDLDESGSGYTNIARVIGNSLHKKYNVLGLGISYNKRQHNFDFGVTQVRIPYIIQELKTLQAHRNLRNVIICLDIPLTNSILKTMRPEDKTLFNFIGIYAVESDPLVSSWAMDLLRLDHRFPISEFGETECKKVGLECQHFPVPIDLSVWKMRVDGEKEKIKTTLGLSGKTVFFVNADGNERKNLSIIFEALSILKKRGVDAFVVLLTRKNSPMTWDLDSLSTELDVKDRILILDRGLSLQEVRQLYVGADFFLNPAKAEGANLPTLEAMACGVPVVLTDCTAMHEHLGDGTRGLGLKYDYVWRDPFGNGRRYLVFPDNLANVMEQLVKNSSMLDDKILPARKYVEARTVEKAVSMIESVLVNE